MTIFRPCIDIHNGQVKQIVGGTLSDEQTSVKTNFVSSNSTAYYAELYRKENLRGGHVIKLGKGNDDAAKEAIEAWPGGLHVGGGITEENALSWIEAGAEKVIVTSYLFPHGKLDRTRLENISQGVGKENLVIDLSCRKQPNGWFVAMNRWQDITDTEVNYETLNDLGKYCSEFLIHAADVEGLVQGVDEELVHRLGEWSPGIPITYAGGARNLSDIELVEKLSQGRVDLTFGSALDIFGGTGVKFEELVEWNKNRKGS